MNIDRLTFRSSGTECVAHVYKLGTGSRAVILCPGFGGTQDTPSIKAVAAAFAEAGYNAVTFDYRNFGASAGQPRQLPDMDGQVADIAAVIERVRELPFVDPEAVALWGTSLGGGHVVTAAADDPRIMAVVAQIPFNGFPKQGRPRKSANALLRAVVRDRIRGWLGREPFYVATVGATNELAVMTGPEVTAAIASMDSPTWENRVAPRALLTMMRYKPGRSAPRLRMPLLVCVGDRDKETLADDSVQLAELAPQGTVRRYPFSHFEFYQPESRATVLADQLAFLDDVRGNS